MNIRYDVYEQYKNKENLEDSPVVSRVLRKKVCRFWHE